MTEFSKQFVDRANRAIEHSVDVAEMWTGTQHESTIEHSIQSLREFIDQENETEAVRALAYLEDLTETSETAYRLADEH